MSSASAVPSLIDRLLVVFTAAVTVPVLDGPVVDDSNRKGFVSVGWNGAFTDAGIPDDGTVADISQDFSTYIGNLDKDETASITCGSVSWTGGKTFKPVRDLAWDQVSDCEQALRTALRNDAALQALVSWCGVASGSYDQTIETDGLRARVEFTVQYTARI